MCPLKTKRSAAPLAWPLAAAIALGAMLGGCSDIYFDRRDPVALGVGDAIAANEAMQTIDPWPAQSGNTNLAANGQRMQSAIEHYRTNTGVAPVDPLLMVNANTSPTAAQNSSQTGSTSPLALPSIAPGTSSTTTTVITAPGTNSATTTSQ